MEGGAYRFKEEEWALGHVVVMGGEGGLGGGGSRVVLPFLLVVVAVLQVLTLNVPAAVVCARELNAVLVHTPADASFAATRWLALLALEESFSVTVWKVQRQSHYTRSVLHSLNDPIQFSPACTKFGLMLVNG